MSTHSHASSEAHGDDAADLAQLHSLLGHYSRMLWDIQKMRVGLSNRSWAMDRDQILPEHRELAESTASTLEKQEEKINRYLATIAKRHPLADWIGQAPGIGLPSFARLLAVTGPLDKFPNVAKLWKFLGLHVVNGEAPKRRKGDHWTHTNCQGLHPVFCKPDCTTDHHPNCMPNTIGTAYSPQGRVVCYQIGVAIVRVGRGKYREAYDVRKAYYEVGRPDWTQAHRHNAAVRYAVKELVKDMWIAWQQPKADAPLSPV